MAKAKPASRQAINRSTRKGLAALIPLLKKGETVSRKDIIAAIPKNERSKYSTTYYLKKSRDSLQELINKFQAGTIDYQTERKFNAAFKIAETAAKNAPKPPEVTPGPGADGWELFLVVQRWEWQSGIQAAQDEIFDGEANVIIDIAGDVEELAPGEVEKNITLINSGERKARGEKTGKKKGEKEGEEGETKAYQYSDATIEINRGTKQIRVTFT